LRADPDMSLDTLTARLRARRFHAEDATDAAIRNDMVRYAWRLFPATPQPEPIQFDTLDSVNAAVMCNDMAYEGDSTHHQNKISTLARTLPATNGLGLQYHCVFWGGAQATRPPMSRMGAAGDILMVHASLDPVTPLQNAQAAHAATPTARLLVADGIDGHGVFGFTDSACVEHTVGRYLLTGVLPAGREYRCAAVPAAHGGPASGFARPDRVAELRDELAGMRSPFARLGGIRP
jgi:hypothetical protein